MCELSPSPRLFDLGPVQKGHVTLICTMSLSLDNESHSPKRRKDDLDGGECTDSECGEELSESSSTASIDSPGKAGSNLADVTVADKKVRFTPVLRLVLIPCVSDYRKAGLIETMWWTQQDFFSFQQSAFSEIRQMAKYDGITHLEARRKLYQPEVAMEIDNTNEQRCIASVSEVAFANGNACSDSTGPAVAEEDIVCAVALASTPPPSLVLALKTIGKSPSMSSLDQLIVSSIVGEDSEGENEAASRSCRSPSVSNDNDQLHDQSSRRNGPGSLGSSPLPEDKSADLAIRSQLRAMFRDSIENLRQLEELSASSPSNSESVPLCLPHGQAGGGGWSSPSQSASHITDPFFCVPGPELPLVDKPKPSRKGGARSWSKVLVQNASTVAGYLGWASALALAVVIAHNCGGLTA